MKHLKASDLAGLDVRGMSGEDAIGEINDVVIGRDGKVAYVAVSFGGFLGLGDKLFAVPFEAVEFVRDADDADERYARIDVTEETLKSKPGFNQDNWPDEADQSFMRQGARTARQPERPILPAGSTQAPR
jgi:sporulation protein YlmC with PRC-barrel domain